MAPTLTPRIRNGFLFLRFTLQGINFYRRWGRADNPEHVARMRYICRLVESDIASGRFTNLEPYFDDVDLYDWHRVAALIEAKPENASNTALLKKLHTDKPRLNGPEHVKKWLDSMPIQPQTKARYLGVIKSVAPKICQGVSYRQKGLREPNPFNRHEQSLIKAMLDYQPYEFKALVTLWLYAGLRPGEARALTVHDYDKKTQTLVINKSMTVKGVVKSTKTGKSRTIWVSDEVSLIMDAYVYVDGVREHLFPSTHHHSNWCKRRWYPFLKSLGIEDDRRPYRLRHTAITEAVMKNPSRIAAIAKDFGTSPQVIFDHYLGFTETSSETMSKT